MSIHTICAAFFVCFLFAVTPVSAANVPGDPCTAFGTTLLSDDQANIIACLWDDGGHTAKHWKAMTTTPSGTSAGNCINGWSGVDLIGVPIAPAYYDNTIIPGCTYDTYPCRKGCSCPAGYVMAWTGTCDFGNCMSAATGGSVTGQLYAYTCIKK